MASPLSSIKINVAITNTAADLRLTDIDYGAYTGRGICCGATLTSNADLSPNDGRSKLLSFFGHLIKNSWPCVRINRDVASNIDLAFIAFSFFTRRRTG
jgi:hypothetical protein